MNVQLEELKKKIQCFQGQKEIRISIYALIRLLRVWQKEQEQHIVYTPVPLHLIFSGNDGTGRTQTAALVGQLYRVMGVLSEGNLVKAKLKDLLQPEAETLIQKAQGNVLLLSGLEEWNAETAKALETVMNRYLKNFIVILKGTPKRTERVFQISPEFRLRFCQEFCFSELQPEQKARLSGQTLEIFDISSLTEHAEQLQALQEEELLPKEIRPGKLDKNDRTGEILQPGARLDLTPYLKQELRIRLVYEKLKLPMELDIYVFILREDDKAQCEEDMIFFGNRVSSNNEVTVVSGAEYPEAVFVLSRVYQNVQKIAVCFSAYGNHPEFDFSKVEKPILQICCGENQLVYMDLSNLQTERTLVAGELYRYQNTWKFRAVSAGYRAGLKELCQRYGIEAE